MGPKWSSARGTSYAGQESFLRPTSSVSEPILIEDSHLNLPATTVAEFQDLERDINEEFTKECIFVNELRETEAESVEKYIRKCLRKILTDEAASKFSWRGNAKHIPVNKFTVLKILKSVKTFMEPEFQEMTVIKTEVEETSSYPPRAASPLLLPLMSTDPHLNLPATTALEFQNFERDINEDFTKECIFVNELRETEAPSLDKYIRKCLRKIITDEAARKFSWRGNKRNIPVNNYSVLRILKYEASQKFPNTPINSVDPIVRRWFRYAKDRFNKKFKYYTSYCSSSKLLALRRAS